MRLLTLVRHGKSDWSVDCDDRARPLNDRGRRQAPITGAWMAAHLPKIDSAVVSPAERAQATWALVADQLRHKPDVSTVEALYTFDGDDLFPVVRALSPMTRHAVLVGHNPAFEEFIAALTGQTCEIKTSARAVLTVPSSWSQLSAGSCELLVAGRPESAELGMDS